jgi:hypothetical protein
MADSIKIQILEDGTVSIETDAISGKNHMSADEFLKMVEKLTGGESKRKAKEGHAAHTHGTLIHSH